MEGGQNNATSSESPTKFEPMTSKKWSGAGPYPALYGETCGEQGHLPFTRFRIKPIHQDFWRIQLP